jgi:phosphate-selective porin OprO/OprP
MAGFRQAVLAGSMFILLPAAASAADNAELMAALKQMQQQLNAQQAQIQRLQQELEKKETVAQQAPVAAAVSAAAPASATVQLKPGPEIVSADGDTLFALDGRVVTDAGFVMKDNADIADATDMRYLWLGVKGRSGDWGYAMDVKDAFVSYHGFDGAMLQVGNFKEFNGIDLMSSNLHTTFMERSSAVTTFRPLRRLGVGSTFNGERWTVQLGAFGDDPGNSPADDEGYSFTGRVVAAPILDLNRDHVLHLGATARYQVPDADKDNARFRTRGESHVIGAYLADTGTIANVDHTETYGAEARYTYGPLALTGEYNVTRVDVDNASDPLLSGGYVSASWFLTGEQRGYKLANGTYGRVKPDAPLTRDGSGYGAWELAGRYSFVDLSDEMVSGGEMDSYTLGLNWYPTANTKFMLNYVFNETDADATMPDNDPQYLMLRAQADF